MTKRSTGKKDFRVEGEDAQRAFRAALGEVGRNLPSDPVEVEGSDVDHIVRHENGKKDEDEAIRESLDHPHADTPRKTVDELDL